MFIINVLMIATCCGINSQEACKFLPTPLIGKPLIVGLSKVINLYYNYTGDAKCVDWTGGRTPGLGYSGWDFQV